MKVDDVVQYEVYGQKGKCAYGIIVGVHTSQTGNTYVRLRFIGNKGLGEKVYSYLMTRAAPIFDIQDLRDLHDAECP